MACNLLSYQGLQAERRDSIPLRSTIQMFRPVGFPAGLSLCYTFLRDEQIAVCRGYGYGLERPGEKPGSGFLMIQS